MQSNNDPLTLLRAMILPFTLCYRVLLLSVGGGRDKGVKTLAFSHRIVSFLSYPVFINKGENVLILF